MNRLATEFAEISVNQSVDIAGLEAFIAQGKTMIAPCDFCVIHGNRNPASVWPLARAASDFYFKGMIRRKIVLTGGFAYQNNTTEADALYRALLQIGVPKKALEAENRSRHTGGNVIEAKRIILAQQTSPDIICIGVEAGGPRFLMTHKSKFPEAFVMSHTVPESHGWAQNWRTDPEMLHDLQAQADRIGSYLEQGHIAAVDHAAINERARQILNNHPHLTQECQ